MIGSARPSVRCPYLRPFEHPTGCGCVDCATRGARSFWLACTAAVLALVLFGCSSTAPHPSACASCAEIITSVEKGWR